MNPVSDTYFTISAPCEGLFKDQGSRFISLGWPVEDEQSVKEILTAVRKEHHGARHHCYAYRLGYDGACWRSSDDGEPSGSAGRQILGRIDAAGLRDILVVVVRYFGGIKLGIPGLIRAYKSAAADALAAAQVVSKIAASRYRLTFPYAELPGVMRMAKEMGLEQLAQDFGMSCSLDLRVRLSLVEDFLDRIKKTDIFILKL